MLALEGVETAYGDSKVLFGIDLSVAAGEVVTLLGRNGMGKTTTVRSIMGLTRARAGAITSGSGRCSKRARRGGRCGSGPSHSIAAWASAIRPAK